MNNPYKVLGVSPNATDDEIKQAYRELARKYHPDKYRDSDLSDLAEEKMKEINAAYEEIQKLRKQTGGESGSQNSGSQYGSSSAFGAIRTLINRGEIREAEHRLYAVPESSRNAEWYFLMGCVMLKKGFYFDAQKMFDRACEMDPNNAEYRSAKEQLYHQTSQYGGGYRTTQHSSTFCDSCDCCSTLICADCCCECMGGDLIACC